MEDVKKMDDEVVVGHEKIVCGRMSDLDINLNAVLIIYKNGKVDVTCSENCGDCPYKRK